MHQPEWLSIFLPFVLASIGDVVLYLRPLVCGCVASFGRPQPVFLCTTASVFALSTGFAAGTDLAAAAASDKFRAKQTPSGGKNNSHIFRYMVYDDSNCF